MTKVDPGAWTLLERVTLYGSEINSPNLNPEAIRLLGDFEDNYHTGPAAGVYEPILAYSRSRGRLSETPPLS